MPCSLSTVPLVRSTTIHGALVVTWYPTGAFPTIEQLNDSCCCATIVERSQRRPKARSSLGGKAEEPSLRNLDLGHRGHRVERRLLPGCVPDMRLVHHVIPAAIQQLVVVLVAQRSILAKSLLVSVASSLACA